MPELDKLDVKTTIHPEDSTKAISTISGGETANNRHASRQVLTTTTPLADDPTKTETVIETINTGNVKLKVVGKFNGEVEVKSGTVLKEALAKLNTEEHTFGQFKYRDEKDNPVGIMNRLGRDTILISLSKN